jgi:hypothetical protein
MAKPVKQIPGNCRVGDGTPGPGRPKGSANKATTAVREAIARFAENNVEQLQGWLEKSAEKNPDKAADLFFGAQVSICRWHDGLVRLTGAKDGAVFFCPTGVSEPPKFRTVTQVRFLPVLTNPRRGRMLK